MKRILLLFLGAVLLLLGGCSLGGSIDELYSLPQLADEYVELQKAIDAVLSGGAVYSAPVDGVHRQSVQLCDLNRDGEEEAVAFFATAGDKPLKIYIFRRSAGKYEKAAVIEGAGSSIESIDYEDLDGDGWMEAVVGWGMGGDLKMLELYTLKGYQVASIAAADYSRYLTADMNGDGRKELVAVRRGSAEAAGSVTLYAVAGDGETISSTERLSVGLDGITKLAVGALKDRPSALFVEGSCQGGLVTDILTYEDEALKNITLDPVTGVSEGNLRSSTAAFQDLSGDGSYLIPIPRALPAQGETVYRVLDWYGYNSRGKRTIVTTTYHNYSDSWYLILPDSWGEISLRREDSDVGERAVVFSFWNGEGEPVTDFLVIYTLSGENRVELAGREGRSVIRSGGETIYAAELRLSRSEWPDVPDMAWLRQNFRPIYSEWTAQ